MKVGDIIPPCFLRLGYIYSFGYHGDIFKAICIDRDKIYIKYVDDSRLDVIHFYDQRRLRIVKIPTELEKALV